MSGGYSYNGWPASDDKQAIGVAPFGDNAGCPFPGGVKAGDVATVFAYLCTQLHYRVERVVDGWNWGYSYRANVNNPSQLSCHASATAVDWNAPYHPNGTSTGPGGGGGWTGDQYAEVCVILAELDGVIDWLTSNDPMHFEICTDADAVAAVAARLPPVGPPTPPDDGDRNMICSVIASNGALNVFAISGGRVFQQWPDPAQPGGWSGWIAGIPGEWSDSLSVTVDAGGHLSVFGADTGGTVQQAWSSTDGWHGPVPFPGITVGG